MAGMVDTSWADKNELRGKLQPQTRLRGYVIDSVLGYGGFGIVYRAHHEELGHSIAIKEFLPADLSVREGNSVRPRGPDCSEYFEDGKQRFLAEARQLVQFRSDSGVISCLDFFRANGTAYFVMEHVEGLSLAQLLQRREKAGSPLNQKQMVSIVVPLIETLSRVHAAGVLHRDIKPSNILIRRKDEKPVLIDFGAAKQSAVQYSKSFAPFTEGYAAIEQVGGGEIGQWTDIYGVGAVMWRIVAGANPPWDPPNPVSIVRRMNAQLRGSSDPLPSAVSIGRGNFSHQLLRKIDKCLRIQEVDRYQTSQELLDELQEDQLNHSMPRQQLVIERGPKVIPHSRDLESLTKIPGPSRSIGYTIRNWVRSILDPKSLYEVGIALSPRVNEVKIMNSPTNGYAYGAGEVLYVRVQFNAQIETVGSPKLALRIGSQVRHAFCYGYKHNDGRPNLLWLMNEERNRCRVGKHALLFRYSVHVGDSAAGGIGIATDALTLSGGSIRSVGGARAILDLGSCAVVEDRRSRVDGRMQVTPRAGGVAVLSRPSHGSTYRAGETIIVGVRFTTLIRASHFIKLNLTVGNLMRKAHYRETLWNWLLFQYMVRADDMAKDGICIGADRILLNGGFIRGTGKDGTPAAFDLGSHAFKRFSKHKVNGCVAIIPAVRRVELLRLPSNGIAYGAGEEIRLWVDFGVPLDVTGSPRLAIEIGGRTCQAAVSLSCGSRLDCRYLVKAEDRDTDGLRVSRGALTLNGGSISSIQSIGGAPAVLDLGGHAFQASMLKVDGSIATAPKVRKVAVASHPSNGTAYGAGEEIRVWVESDLPLEVTGSPQLELNVGDRTRQARYYGSREVGALWFKYRVQAEDTAPEGIAVAPDALSLNGGSIRSKAAAPAVLNLGKQALKRDAKHKVDGRIATAPKVQRVLISSRPSNGTVYGAGEEIKVRVGFNVPLKVTGSPQLELKVGGGARQARYSMSVGDSLWFGYRVKVEDTAPVGLAIAPDAMSLNGGSIRSLAGAPAALDLGTHAFKRNSKHKVNGNILTAPKVRDVQVSGRPSNGTAYGAGEEIDVEVDFDLPLKVTGSPQLALQIGGRKCQAAHSRSWGLTLSFTYLVQAEDAAPGGIAVEANALSVNGGSISSLAAAPAVLDLGAHAFKRDSKHKVDGSIATVPQVKRLRVSSRPSNGTAYGAGEEIEVWVYFDLSLKVTGSPQLTLTVGDRLRQARYSRSGVSGSSLRFAYRVQAKDAAPRGIAVEADALSLNGGSVRSLAAAPAVLDLGTHAFRRDSKHRVNGTILTAPKVRGVQVSSHPSNGTAYGAGEEIEVRVDFDFYLPLKVAGSPQLELSLGNHLRQARYLVSSVSGSSLWFAYRVQTEDAAPEGIAVAPDALSLNGGSIRSYAAAPAVLDLGKHALKRDSKNKIDGRIATAPKVKSVRISSRPSNGTVYGAGEEIKVSVGFTVPVEVTGAPRMLLNLGGRMRNAQSPQSEQRYPRRFASFGYPVQAEDAAPGGISIAPDALKLNGGKILSSIGIAAVLDLGEHAIPSDSTHRIDGNIVRVPQVDYLFVNSSPSNGAAYVAGEEIEVFVFFDLPIEVDGSPRLELKVGDRMRLASCSEIDRSDLSFGYRVQAEDTAPEGIAIAPNALSLNGGSIRSRAGAPAVLDLGRHFCMRGSKDKGDGSIATAPTVEGLEVPSRPSNGTVYGAGEEIKLRVLFNQPLEVTGSPQLGLMVGDHIRSARYALTTGSSLWFRYFVQTEDAAPEGLAISPDALSLKGGSIRSTVGMAAVLDLGKDTLEQDSEHKVDGSITIAPEVRCVRVSSHPSYYTDYAAGERIEISVGFTVPIQVTGAPRLLLNVGERKRNAPFRSMRDDGNVACFKYRVRTEDAAPEGISIAPDALSLNGGSIRSMAGASAVLDLGRHALKRDSNHTVTAPQVQGLGVSSRPCNGKAYGAGEEIRVRVDFDDGMDVTGSPRLGLKVGDRTRRALYLGTLGLGGQALCFGYRVQADDSTQEGISIAAEALTLNGGSICGISLGIEADLDLGKHFLLSDPTPKVDGRVVTVPHVVGLDTASRPANDTAFGAGEEIRVRVDFDQPLEVTGTPQLELGVGERMRQARYLYLCASASGCSLFFQYVVQAEDAAPEGVSIAWDALGLHGGSIRSMAGAPVVLDIGKGGRVTIYKVDGSICTVPHVKGLEVPSRPSNGTAYGVGEGIEVRVDFDFPVKVTGSPQLAIKVGDRIRQARYSGRTVDGYCRFFHYTVRAEDAAPEGIAIAADALSLNGGSIQSIDGTPAVLDLGEHAIEADWHHKVDDTFRE